MPRDARLAEVVWVVLGPADESGLDRLLACHPVWVAKVGGNAEVASRIWARDSENNEELTTFNPGRSIGFLVETLELHHPNLRELRVSSAGPDLEKELLAAGYETAERTAERLIARRI